MLEIYCDFNDFESNFDEDIINSIEEVCNIVLIKEKFLSDYEVSISFVDDDYIKNLNNEYRYKNNPTDVLSFPMYEVDELKKYKDVEVDIPILLGDIIVSFPTAMRQSEEYGHSLKREIVFLICHSMLHLLGYDHIEDSDRVLMEEKQREIMSEIGIDR